MMKIVIITNKNDITSDFIVRKLQEKKVNFYRLNTEEIGKSINIQLDFTNNSFLIHDTILNCTVNLLDIRSVYFRRPEVNVESDGLTIGEINFLKSEILFTLEGIYRILDNAYWLNNVHDIRKAENKIHQMRLAKSIGFTLPNSFIGNVPEHAFKFYQNNNHKCIIKPIKVGLVQSDKEEGLIFTNEVELTDENKNRIKHFPVYLQEKIVKKGDVRVTVVGNQFFAAFIDSQVSNESMVDWRKCTHPLDHQEISLPDDIITKCLLLMEELNLHFGAIDFILTKPGGFVFLEINPNGQWAWIETRLKYKISETITAILIEESIK